MIAASANIIIIIFQQICIVLQGRRPIDRK